MDATARLSGSAELAEASPKSERVPPRRSLPISRNREKVFATKDVSVVFDPAGIERE